MKIISCILLALTLTAEVHAASFGFVKIGERYTLAFTTGQKGIVQVLADEGDGWYRCRAADGDITIVNFNLVLEITPAR